jgi:molybdopterin synthase catalytic subunit
MEKRGKMDIQEMVNTLKGHPDSNKVGMIATHLGVVRGTSRAGGNVTSVEVEYDYDIMANIISDIKNMSGIVEVIVNAVEGELHVGDEILAVAVAGDIRENVFSALIKAVDRIKTEAAKKKEDIIT